MLRFPISKEKSGKSNFLAIKQAVSAPYEISWYIGTDNKAPLRISYKFNIHRHEIEPVKLWNKHICIFNVLKEVGC